MAGFAGRASSRAAALAAVLAMIPAGWGQDTEALLARAAAAYDQGRCAEVIGAYGQAEERSDEALDGVAEYRWGFCLAYLRRPGARQRYEAAVDKLGQAVDRPGAPLEAHFYMVNALLNLGRADDARERATRAVAAWRGGELTVPEDEPEAWFRLGKLFRDSGDPRGAVEPFTRAVEAAENGATLRDAYLERIARGAGEAGAGELALRAARLLEKAGQAGTSAMLRVARARLAGGDFDGAREAFSAAAKGPGEPALAARYALRGLERLAEVQRWGLEIPSTAADGRPLSALSVAELRNELQAAARQAWTAFSGRVVEVPRKKKPGTRPAPHPETLAAMRTAQARFVGIVAEALRRGLPLREWNVQIGIGPLIFHPWYRLFLQRATQDRSSQLVQFGE
ncbi:MAG: tetratricopeptide repeat protein [Acidobacteriota bacterium]|nr:tetratricopeptide repeat protein [Acidobacteriota bacterium]